MSTSTKSVPCKAGKGFVHHEPEMAAKCKICTPYQHKAPPYSERGPVFTVCPIERVEELGSHTAFLVVDLDYDQNNHCGDLIAECSRFEVACRIADALNFLNGNVSLPVRMVQTK